MVAGNNQVRIIDTSTAHRVNPDWTYGFAEMDREQAKKIAGARCVANPGCYPTGAIGLLRPLRLAGILPEDYPVTVNAVSPGPLDSPTVRRVLGDRLEESARAIPVGRLGSMPFIAEMVALLASPEAASVTGATWDANGGLYMR